MDIYRGGFMEQDDIETEEIKTAGKSTINAPPPHVSRRESEGAIRQTMARKKEKWKFFARCTLAAELQVCN